MKWVVTIIPQYLSTKKILLKPIKQCFIKLWTGLSDCIIKKNSGKPINIKMRHLDMKRKWVKSTGKKSPDIDLRKNSKKI